jgi:hypothetical protein
VLRARGARDGAVDSPREDREPQRQRLRRKAEVGEGEGAAPIPVLGDVRAGGARRVRPERVGERPLRDGAQAALLRLPQHAIDGALIPQIDRQLDGPESAGQRRRVEGRVLAGVGRDAHLAGRDRLRQRARDLAPAQHLLGARVQVCDVDPVGAEPGERLVDAAAHGLVGPVGHAVDAVAHLGRQHDTAPAAEQRAADALLGGAVAPGRVDERDAEVERRVDEARDLDLVQTIVAERAPAEPQRGHHEACFSEGACLHGRAVSVVRVGGGWLSFGRPRRRWSQLAFYHRGSRC